MVKVKRVTISLATGNVIENRLIELPAFTRVEVIVYGESFDGFSDPRDNLENILDKSAGQHRAVIQTSDDLITRYMDKFPQYYIKM